MACYTTVGLIFDLRELAEVWALMSAILVNVAFCNSSGWRDVGKKQNDGGREDGSARSGSSRAGAFSATAAAVFRNPRQTLLLRPAQLERTLLADSAPGSVRLRRHDRGTDRTAGRPSAAGFVCLPSLIYRFIPQ